MIDKNNFKGLHYNGIPLIDFKYDADNYQNFFLQYFNLLSFPQDDSGISEQHIKNDLKYLFDIIYVKDDVGRVTYDLLSDEQVKIKFDEQLNNLIKKNNKQNMGVRVLFEYIKHRAVCYERKEFKKIIQSEEVNFNQINITDIIKKTYDMKQFILLLDNLIGFSMELYILFQKHTEYSSSDSMRNFIFELNSINTKFSKGKIKVSDLSEYEYFSFDKLLSFHDFANYLSDFVKSCPDKDRMEMSFETLCKAMLIRIKIGIHEFVNARDALHKIVYESEKDKMC